jgi:hypothetical protein
MKIQSYENDNNISLEDKVTGSDADDSNKTKNYTFKNIVAFLKGQGLGGSNGIPLVTVDDIPLPPCVTIKGIINQRNADPPMITILEDTIKCGYVLSRYAQGGYLMDFDWNILNPELKVFLMIGSDNYYAGTIFVNSPSIIIFRCIHNINGYQDDLFLNTPFEITIYSTNGVYPEGVNTVI